MPPPLFFFDSFERSCSFNLNNYLASNLSCDRPFAWRLLAVALADVAAPARRRVVVAAPSEETFALWRGAFQAA
jgi:hypothetical protein